MECLKKFDTKLPRAARTARQLQLVLDSKGDRPEEAGELASYVDECLSAQPGLLERARAEQYSDNFFDKVALGNPQTLAQDNVEAILSTLSF